MLPIKKVATALLLTSTLSYSQEIQPKKSLLTLQAQAYGFYLGQQTTVDTISELYPDLSPRLAHASATFKASALGNSQTEIETALKAKFQDKWPSLKQALTSQVQKAIPKNQPKSIAEKFVTELENRAKGQMQKETRAVLLAHNPTFIKQPALELARGWKQTITTKDHKKSKGLDISISFPASWSIREGTRPNIIKALKSKIGHGNVQAMFAIEKLPAQPKVEEQKTLLSPASLKQMLPPGAIFLSSQKTKFDGQPGAFMTYDHTTERAGIKINSRNTQALVLYKQYMIFVQFSSQSIDNNKESINATHKLYQPTFKLISASLVINDQYKQ